MARKHIGNIQSPKIEQKIPANAKEVFTGKLFRVFQWDTKMFDGTNQTFEKIVCNDSAYILPITENDEVVIAEQCQPGRDKFIGLIGGRLEPCETPFDASLRELSEEAGIHAGILKFLGAWRPLEKVQWCKYYFAAYDLDFKDYAQERHGEVLTLITLTIENFCNLVRQDSFKDMYIKNYVLRHLLDGGIDEVRRNLLKWK